MHKVTTTILKPSSLEFERVCRSEPGFYSIFLATQRGVYTTECMNFDKNLSFPSGVFISNYKCCYSSQLILMSLTNIYEISLVMHSPIRVLQNLTQLCLLLAFKVSSYAEIVVRVFFQTLKGRTLRFRQYSIPSKEELQAFSRV